LRASQLFPAFSMLILLASCSELPHDQVQFDLQADCPEQTATTLLANASQLSSLSDTQTLACALNVLRNSQDPTVLRSSLASRLCIHLAERQTTQEQRLQLASEGVRFAETALAQGGGTDGAVHYYLAINLGLVVRDNIVQAMANLDRLQEQMKQAAALSPNLDDGGPLRILGMFYLKAPAWPKGNGDPDKALELLQQAVTAHSQHPLNHLFYAQALWNEGDAATLPQVKAEFALGEKLLAAGDWGYSKQPWEKEFAEFRLEFVGRK
jgi:hypothetical protein